MSTRRARRSAGTRSVVETKNLWRNRQAFSFTILFPVMMLLLFASIFTGTVDGTDRGDRARCTSRASWARR